MSETMNQVPWLRSGVGSTPSDGGCIMQVIDWIHREQWTDSPPCVHPVIRALAININDSANDQERQELLDLAPRMMGTASDDKQLSVKLAIFCAERVLHIFEEKYPDDDRPRKAIEAARNGDKAADAAYYAANAAAYYAANAANAAAYYATNAAYYAANAAAYYAANAANAANAAAYYAANAANAAADAAVNAAVKLDLLVAVLGEYDRLVPRVPTEEIDWAPAVCVMAGA